MAKVMVTGPFSTALATEADGGFKFSMPLRKKIMAVLAVLERAGFEVLSAHVSDHFGELKWTDEFCERDLHWVSQCDAQVVLLPASDSGESLRSDGTMIELGYAQALGKPTILLIERLDSFKNSHFLRAFARRAAGACLDWTPRFEMRLAAEINRLLSNQQKAVFTVGDHPFRQQRSDVEQVLAELRREVSPHTVAIGGILLTVLPEVFSPRFSHAPDALMSKWKIPKGARVLDIGCGCGVLGLCALAQGAGSLVALDVNPQAVENTALNLRNLNWSERGNVRLSDVYGALQPGERFDVILFAAPYWNRIARDDLERACFDGGYRFFSSAVAHATSWLAPGGVMYIIFSNQGDVGFAARAIAASGLVVDSLDLFPPTQNGGHIRIVWQLRRPN